MAQPTHPTHNYRSILRSSLRKRRQALSPQQQIQAGKKLCRILSQQTVVTDNQHFAIYLATDGEINTVALRDFIWQSGKQCYLPIVRQIRNKNLLFVEYRQDTSLTFNRYGILEPSQQSMTPIGLDQLNVVFIPLTGFDETGHRLGMGGGYYDTTFEFTKNTQKPILIGLAHECQKVKSIPTEAWDVQMSGIATDEHFYSFSN